MRKSKYTFKEPILVPNIPLTARNKNRISKILSRKNIVFSESKDERNDLFTVSITNLQSEELVKYEKCDRSYHTIILNGEIVADIEWNMGEKVSPQGQRIFDTISLIESKHKAFMER